MKSHLLLILSVIIISSCTQNEEILLENNSKTNNANKITKKLEFTYNDEFYSSNYYIINDSIIIEDPEIQKIYDKFRKNENRFILISEDESITFFDSYDEYQRTDSLKKETQTKASTSIPHHNVFLYLYNHDVTIGTFLSIDPKPSLGFNYSSYFTPFQNDFKDYSLIKEIPDLRLYDFNDKLTWAELCFEWYNMKNTYCVAGEAYVVFYEHVNYQGNSVSTDVGITKYPRASSVSTLVSILDHTTSTCSIQMKNYFFSNNNGKSFNDQASSFKLYHKNFRVLQDYIPTR